MNTIFNDLFVLEIANNHWGSVERGLELIRAYSQIARFEGIKVGIKMQFRDVPTFIHKEFLNSDNRYIKKTKETALTKDQFEIFVREIKRGGCIPMTTCFDEASVKWAQDLGIEIIKLASSDINDWPLIEEVAKLRKPIICSNGGCGVKETDNLVLFCEHRNIPLAINHCVALYPTEDWELELNQIDWLKGQYPNHVIGFSTHEKNDWFSSMLIAYAKGARTFERHVDIPYPLKDHEVSPYCSLPHQIVEWIRIWKKAQAMCGGSHYNHRICSQKEIQYLDGLVRGMYAKRDLKVGDFLEGDNIYYAIPLQKKQLSCRENQITNNTLLVEVAKDAPITIDMIKCENFALKDLIYSRGI